MKNIAVITDFGDKDWYAKVLTGVILRICPEANVLDITHQVPAGNIRAGAFILENAYRYFPEGTVFLCVVDPGVGGDRTPIIVRTAKYVFVAPDNGILSYVLSHEEPLQIHKLESPSYHLSPLSNTFHGRDIFAPVAAHFLNDVPMEHFGPEQEDLNILPWPRTVSTENGMQGEVMYIDHFGNCITSITSDDLKELPKGESEVILPSDEKIHIADYYDQLPLGQPMALVGSGGYLELSVNGGHGSRSLGLRVGDTVVIRVIVDKEIH